MSTGFDPVSIIGGVVSDVFSGVLGNVDKGHWEGSKFVPGDLQSRQNQVDQWLQQYGLTYADVDYSIIQTYLYSESGWQGKVTGYLDQVVNDKRSTVKSNISDAQSSQVPPAIKLSGFSNNTILIMIALGAVLFFMFRRTA